MKKYFGALLLLPLVLMVMAQFATAQDTMSAVLSTPYNSRPGTQVLYYFNEGTISTSGSDTYKTFLTITNTSSDTAVLVHYQFYNAATCAETFDYVDILTAQDTNVIDPAKLVTIDGDFRGTIENGKFLLTATAVDASLGQGIDTRAVSFNYLIGQQFITNTKTGTSFGGNAVTRMAVNALGASLDNGFCYVTPKDFGTSHAGKYAIGDANYPSFPGCDTTPGRLVPGYVVTGLGGLIDGAHNTLTGVTADTIRLLQMFRPAALIVPNFLPPGNVDAYNRGTSMQFGNRLTLVSATDVYDDNVATQFKLTAPKSVNLFAWFYDMNEKPISLGQKTVSCVTEYVISPRNVNGGYAGGVTSYAGIGTDILGGATIASLADEGGYIRLNLLSPQGNSWWFGWFSQSYSVPAANMYAGVGDLLVGLGRKDLATLSTATTIQGVAGQLPATEGFYTTAGTLTNAFVAAGTVTP